MVCGNGHDLIACAFVKFLANTAPSDKGIGSTRKIFGGWWFSVFLLVIALLHSADCFQTGITSTRSWKKNIPHRHQKGELSSFIKCNRLQISSFSVGRTTTPSIRRSLPTSRNTAMSLVSPLIPYDDTWGNLAILTGAATGAQILGNSTRIGQLLGPPVTAMALTFVLASIGVLAPGGTTPAAKSLQLVALNFATPLILLGADLQNCWQRCGSLLVSFVLASVATIVACLVGWKVAGKMLQSALGINDGLAIAAALMAKNIGGGINYIAVGRALNVSPQAIAAGLCIDNLAALIYFPLTNVLGSGRSDVGVVERNNTREEKDESSNIPKESSISVQKVSSAIFASCGLLWLGERLAQSLFRNSSAQLPLCTLLTVVVASVLPNHWLESIRETCNTMGTTCLFLFFSTAGAPGSQVANSVKSSIGPLSIFLVCLYSIHGGILWLCHRRWGGENAVQSNEEMSFWKSAFIPQRLLVASSSAIGGPATSVALAESNGWKSLIVPAILVGNIGYAIATFCGLAYYYCLRR
jgi:uncharacterized membrane protein